MEGELVVALGRAHWNRGCATEAATAVVGMGFTSLGFTRIIAPLGATNDRGAKLLRRLGLRVEANQRPDPDMGSRVPGVVNFLDAAVRRS